MKSSNGEYFVGLDHVRAFAAFAVFTWHFNHVNSGQLSGPVAFPLSIFAEGHVGVAVFMVLSGYLFAKLLDGKQISYLPFLWNRCIRLFPLLLLVFLLHPFFRLDGQFTAEYAWRIASGLVFPVWPNGGWSIAVELHFYLILPVLLAISSRNSVTILAVVFLALAVRAVTWAEAGSVQYLAYWTIVGGIDQFVFGILAYSLRHLVAGRHSAAAVMILALTAYLYHFDAVGGFYSNMSYPSPSPLWIVHPTVLGGLCAFILAWYDNSFSMRDAGVSGFLAKIGASSYSMYLLHYFFVFFAAQSIDERIVELSVFPLVLLASAVTFLLFFPVAYLSYVLVELPPMRFRLRYKRPIRASIPSKSQT